MVDDVFIAAISVLEGEERCAQGSAWETWGKETIGETQA